jgi:ABC-type transport system involved in Fe-S cluster assembly fused permease/ATPase subunit
LYLVKDDLANKWYDILDNSLIFTIIIVLALYCLFIAYRHIFMTEKERNDNTSDSKKSKNSLDKLFYKFSLERKNSKKKSSKNSKNSENSTESKKKKRKVTGKKIK